MMPPWYTDQEIDDLCAGLILNAAKVRHLRAMGLAVSQKPNGRPLVMRGQAELVLSGLQRIQTTAEPEHTHRPNRAAFIAQFGSKLKAA